MKTLRKYISCKCSCKFDGRNYNADQWWNNDKCRYECKKYHLRQKTYVSDLATCNCENEKYLASILDDSAIISHEIIESYEEETNFIEKKATYKMQNIYILLEFLLITIALLIIVSIYCYFIKYQERQNHIFPFHFKHSKLKEIIY